MSLIWLRIHQMILLSGYELHTNMNIWTGYKNSPECDGKNRTCFVRQTLSKCAQLTQRLNIFFHFLCFFCFLNDGELTIINLLHWTMSSSPHLQTANGTNNNNNNRQNINTTRMHSFRLSFRHALKTTANVILQALWLHRF